MLQATEGGKRDHQARKEHYLHKETLFGKRGEFSETPQVNYENISKIY